MIYRHQDYRVYLKDLLVERIKRNSRYSARAFARNIGLAHSSLNAVLSGRSNFTLSSARKVGGRLGLAGKELDYFSMLVELQGAREPSVRESVLERLKSLHPEAREINDLSVDQFRQIADWYHSAILELALLEGFELTPASAASKLGISRHEAELAIERLLRLRLLERDADGRVRKCHEHLCTRGPVHYPALFAFYKQMLAKTSDAIDTQSSQERISGFEMLPFSKEMLPEAREIIEECFSRMVKLSASVRPKDRVYHLSIHCFNVTRSDSENRK
ncbi:MAG TPA: TIGR02147 family protein [Bdellovibrionota bacterium]|nr:TIGR02147 family protein [Bdellovibrionota bacterium]